MLADQDRIFTNLYGTGDWGLEGARARGGWVDTKKFIDNGASQAVALWNPIDLGYSAVQIAYQLAKGTAKAEPGATISIGRVGQITLDDTNSAAMAAPFQFDKTNIEEFSKIY